MAFTDLTDGLAEIFGEWGQRDEQDVAMYVGSLAYLAQRAQTDRARDPWRKKQPAYRSQKAKQNAAYRRRYPDRHRAHVAKSNAKRAVARSCPVALEEYRRKDRERWHARKAANSASA